MEANSSAAGIQMAYGPTAELVVSRIGFDSDGNNVGALIVRTTIDGMEFVVYEEYRGKPDDSAYAIVRLIMLKEDVGPGLEATYGLTFDDGPVVTMFTFAEIEAVAANETDL